MKWGSKFPVETAKDFLGMSFPFLFLFLFYIGNNNKGNPGGKTQYQFFRNHFLSLSELEGMDLPEFTAQVIRRALSSGGDRPFCH